MNKIYCLRCVKPAQLELRGTMYYCSECCAPRNMHFYGNHNGLLTKVAQDSRSRKVWKELSAKQISRANKLDFN